MRKSQHFCKTPASHRLVDIDPHAFKCIQDLFFVKIPIIVPIDEREGLMGGRTRGGGTNSCID